METIFWIDMVGWAASAAVLATFCMNTMMPLRVVAIISNVLFCAFGAAAHIFPVLILHAILLPVNVVRLVQIRRLVHGMQAVEHSELSSKACFHRTGEERANLAGWHGGTDTSRTFRRSATSATPTRVSP